MPTVVGVKFSEYSRIHLLDADALELTAGDRVLVQLDDDEELGTVIAGPRQLPPGDCPKRLPAVIRLATEDDASQAEALKERREEALRRCREEIEKDNLDMRLVDAVCSFDGKRLTFYFASEDRIDFRRLVKELSTEFRARVQMEQIGVRDEAGRLGGCGSCGRALCCAAWLPQFYPVSIKMAKEQRLSLNPAKISGVCGRLLCCLRYECETYTEANARMPKIGSRAKVHNVPGEVLDFNAISEQVTVAMESGARETFPLADVVFETPAGPPPTSRPRPARQAKEAAPVAEAPAAPSIDSAESGEVRKRKRRRRKKPGADAQAAAGAGDTQAGPIDPPPAEAPRAARPRRQPAPARPPQPKAQEPAPAADAAAAAQPSGQQEGAQRSRRRTGRRRRRPAGGASGAPEQTS
ncbi:MAG: hypothetical protein COY42_35540 [Armatimonadetes bacterium CG_4_10_14_0_8_um_filter_66_14]|nr:MAG: hypothetical protein COY42_35540 [Armatimonadetes bacterium CG_4_10_14_0_8_um_filter_66_14]